MREDYWIFVEGVADKRFLEQLIEYHWGKVKRRVLWPQEDIRTYCLAIHI